MRAAEIADILLKHRVIAILRGVRSPRAEMVADALRAGGLVFIEVTLESAGGLETLEALHTSLGKSIYLGAGSIVTAEQADAAVRAGAQYLVSPGLFEDVSASARGRDVLYIPGVLTATEIGLGLRWGHAILKLFPAGLIGTEYLRAVQAPYPEAKFFAVGNIGVEDVPLYLSAGAAGVAMGSQLVGRKDDPETLTGRARAIVASIRDAARIQR